MPKGIAASPGITIGKVYILEKENFCILEYKIKKEEVEKEIERFKEAVKEAKEQLQEIEKKAREKNWYQGILYFPSSSFYPGRPSSYKRHLE